MWCGQMASSIKTPQREAEASPVGRRLRPRFAGRFAVKVIAGSRPHQGEVEGSWRHPANELVWLSDMVPARYGPDWPILALGVAWRLAPPQWL